ncbi:MAG: exodeoxyribonuclease VII large subunit [Pseudomonadota bacterium]
MPDSRDPETGSRPDVLTVSQFNRKVQGLIEGKVPLAWIEGEISNLATPASGHLYFTLKDETSQVRAAMFRNRSRFVTVKPRNGLLVRVQARATLYLPRGDYQLVVEHIEEAGTGALQRAFEQLKAKLAAEGLFDAERKRDIPGFPQCVGVVTSPAGAAVHDIITVLRRRAPWIEVIVYPTLVQGRDAAPDIAAAIAAANRRGECDVLIVGRGGGSLEDLWPFNEEIVARAIVASRIPVISAVGHETDVTIADFVADLRAPTPSAAAERVAPDRNALQARTSHMLRLMQRRLQAVLQQTGAQLALLRKSLVRPDHRLREFRQAFDELDLRAGRALRSRLAEEHTTLRDLVRRLRLAAPDRTLPQVRQDVSDLQERLARALRATLARQQQQLESRAARLNTVSPLATLSRGYAIVRDERGRVVKDARRIPVGAAVTARVADGTLACRVEGVQDNEPGTG